MLIGLIVGACLGGFIGGWSGAIATGFLGWLVGLIIQAQTKKSGSGTHSAPPDPPEDRMAYLERRVSELTIRLEVIEKRMATGAAPAPQPVVTPAAQPVTPPPAPVVTPPPAPIAAVPKHQPEFEPAVEPPPRVEPAAAKVQPPPARSVPPEVEAELASAQPTPLERGLLERLLEGNLVAKLGVVILFFGVAFLLKFAYDRGFFPPGVRLAAVALASAALFGIGYKLLASRRTYALVLMGGGMGLAYLDVFFALKTFGMIGPAAGFGLFAILGVATLLMSVRLDARAFAALGLLGAFLAPILASSGGGHHVILFSYYLLLNLVIFATSWFRSWRELNFIGFLFTFAIGALWGHENYRPELFSTVEPFLVAFFALYLAIPILFAHRQPPQLRGVVDGTLIFGTPLTAAMLQTALTRDMGDVTLAWSAAVASAVYFILATALWRRPNMRLLAQAHLALAVVFGTVAPYFAFGGYPTFAFWTVEGAAIYWIGCRQRSILARAFALFLQLAGAVYFVWVSRNASPVNPVMNEIVVGCMLIAAAALFTARQVATRVDDISATERSLEGAIVAWSMMWLLLGATYALHREFSSLLDRIAGFLVVVSVVQVLAEVGGRALTWATLRLVTAGGVVLLFLAALPWLDATRGHPLEGPGVWAWPLAIAAHLLVVEWQLRDGLVRFRALRQGGGWLLLAVLATCEAAWRYLQRDQSWWVIGLAATGFVVGGLRHRLREVADEKAPRFATVALVWSIAWWYLGWQQMIDRELPVASWLAATLGLVAISSAVFEVAGRLLAWTAMRRAVLVLPVLMALATVKFIVDGGHPFEGWRGPAWLASAVVAWGALWRQERDGVAWRPALEHVTLAWVAILILALELHWLPEHAHWGRAWTVGAPGVVFAAATALVTVGWRRDAWPVAPHAVPFRAGVMLPLLILAALWTFVANVACDGTASPLPYLPVLNPLDAAQLALIAAVVWAAQGEGPLSTVQGILPAAGVAGFFWLNGALLRSVHQWTGVRYELRDLLASVIAQSALSLLWTATALALMFVAGKRRSRTVWMVGAALLGVVVAKLFVNDLGNSGTVARIVSFIGVGVLMLLIGYLSPMPPRGAQEAASEVR